MFANLFVEGLNYVEKKGLCFLKSSFCSFITKNIFTTTFFLVSIVVFFSFPSYDVAFVTDEMTPNWDAVFLQSKEPFVNHNHLYEEGSHSEKLAFRFIPPVILSLLNIDNIAYALVFQFFTLILFYFLLVLVFKQIFNDKVKSLVFSLSITLVFAGHVYVSDYRGIFDTLALDFILMSFLLRNSIISILTLLLSFYCDERALVASLTLFLINAFQGNSYSSVKLLLKSTLYKCNLYLFTSWILYFVIRYCLFLFFGLEIRTGGINLFFEQFGKTFYTIYVGLEGFLIPFFLIFIFLFKNKAYVFSALLLANFFVVFFIAQSVIDINRSMSYGLLLIIFVLMLFNRYYKNDFVYRTIFVVVIINMFYDDSYPLIAQLYRMRFITHSI